MMAGPAALAAQTEAALMSAAIWFDGNGWAVDVGAEITVPGHGDRKERIVAMTQQIVRFFEAGIRAHPQRWHMLQRVFAEPASRQAGGR